MAHADVKNGSVQSFCLYFQESFLTQMIQKWIHISNKNPSLDTKTSGFTTLESLCCFRL